MKWLSRQCTEMFHNEANLWENWELDCVWIPFPWKKSSPSSLILQFSWCIYVFLSCIVHKIQCEISKVSILWNNSIFRWERNSFFNKNFFPFIFMRIYDIYNPKYSYIFPFLIEAPPYARTFHHKHRNITASMILSSFLDLQVTSFGTSWKIE